MKRFPGIKYIVCLLISTTMVLFAGAQPPDSLKRRFPYTKTLPFDADTITTFLFIHRDVSLHPVADTAVKFYSLYHARVSQLAYKVNDSFTVSAWVTEPVTTTKFKRPVVVFQHWGEGNKDQFLAEAIEYSNRGFICLLPDAANKAVRSKYISYSRQGADIIRLSVLSVQRGLDLLDAVHDIDEQNVYFIGHSNGAHIGSILTGIEPRIKAYILMNGVYSLTESYAKSTLRDIAEWRKKDPKGFEQWVATMQPYDGVSYFKNKRAIVYLQFAANDETVPLEQYKQYEKLMPPPKKVDYYPALHEMNSKARADRYSFIMRYKHQKGVK